MVFSSITFLFLFLPVALAVYYIIPEKWKNIVLLAASILFYAWGEPVYVILMVLSILLNYFCGLDIDRKSDDPVKAKHSVVFAVAANVAILAFFKYYAFVLDMLSGILPVEIPYRELPMPIGLSFYTFQSLTYIIDVYRKKTGAQKNILNYALYIAMFPQLIAGPIVRYVDIEEQLTNRRTSAAKLGQGAMLFIRGLAKKAVIANMTGEIFQQISDMPASQMSMLIISGVMIGYICSAVTDFVVTFADDANIVNLHNWSKGSFSGISWSNTVVMAVVVLPTLLGTFLLSKPISAYQMGETYAQNMGIHIGRFRMVLVLLSSILSACVTAFAGPVSFVGIAVPHLVKSLFGTAKPVLMVPACFLGGAVFCLFCDLLARVLFAPTELGISTVTAMFGAPVVIYIIVRRRKEQER